MDFGGARLRVFTSLASLVVFISFFTVSVTGASASEYDSFVQRENGHYAFEDKGKVISEYSKSDGEALLRRIKAVELDSGPRSYARTDISGETLADSESAKRAYESLSSHGEYMTDGEAQVGDGLIADAEADGILPTLADVFSKVGDVGAVVSTGYVAVKIGDGIDEIFGLPSLEEAIGLNGQGELASWGYWAFVSRFSKDHYELVGAGPCNAIKFTHAAELVDIGIGAGNCAGISDEDRTERFAVRAGEEPEYKETFGVTVGPDWSPSNESGIGLLEGQFGISACKDLYWFCQSNRGPEGKDTYTYLKESGRKSKQDNKCETATICRSGYVQTKPSLPNIVETPSEVPIPSKKAAPIAPSKPEDVPVVVPWWIAHESYPEIAPEVGPAPESPAWPEILPVQPNEVYTHYRDRLEAEGFTDVKESVLPESLIDPKIGPEQISRVVPVEKTRAEPSTPVEVVVNPVDAPPVDGEPHEPIGPPNLPGIDKPDFGVVCKGFPFGVPCWIADTISAWSATAKAPTLGIEDWKISIMGHKQTLNAMFDFAKLEPIMSRVRPAMLIFATIGIVLLFFKFAKGGGPPSGSAGDSSDGGEDGGL